MKCLLHLLSDKETLFETADSGDTLSVRRHSIGQQMQKHSMRQWMQETLYGTADAGDTLCDSGCRRHSIGQEMQETLHQTGDAEDTQ